MTHASRFGKVAVLMGGQSTERQVSLNSGDMVLNALASMQIEAEGIDVSDDVFERLRLGGYARAFIALHGSLGEDGSIQGGLDVIGLPYSGSGVMASSICMNKLITKQIWQVHQIQTPKYRVLKNTVNQNKLVEELGLPMIFKPVSHGSSIGITKVGSKEEIVAAWEHAREFEDTVIAEQWIKGHEYTVAILDSRTLPVIRLETPRLFYDYVAKYHSDDTRYHCPCDLSKKLEGEIRNQALKAFKVTGASGWGRVDIMLDDNNQIWFLEINTVPGMTDHSLVPMAAKADGISFNELVVKVLETSLPQHRIA